MLSEKVVGLTKIDKDQGNLLTNLDQELATIKTKLVDYEQSTRLKEDQTKFTKAVVQIQKGSDLTELTMLALKVKEELDRAKQTS
jgi:7,8-dihydro-6-hydroxymethylpterin-pyrophosphokinase